MNEISGKAKERVDELNRLAWQYRYADTGKALSFCREAIALTGGVEGYKAGYAYGLLCLGVCRYIGFTDEELLEPLYEALGIFRETGDDKGLCIALNYLGNVYDFYGDYEKGLSYCIEALKHAKSAKYPEGIADIQVTMGNIYTRTGDLKSAMACFGKSLKIRKKLNDRAAMASSYNLLGRTFGMMGRFGEALEHYQHARDIREKMEDRPGLSWTYFGMAHVYERKGDLKEAILLFRRCYKLKEGSTDVRGKLLALLGLGKAELKLGAYEQAISYLQEALHIANKVKSKPLAYRTHQALAEAWEQTGNIAEALANFKEYQRLKDEVLNAETTSSIKKLQHGFELEKAQNEAEILRLKNEEIRIAYEELDKKNTEIRDSIHYALNIQLAILPSLRGMQAMLPASFILYKARDVVSGDFYWFAPVNPVKGNTKTLIVAADCTGHGIPGAFMSLIGIEKLNQIVLEQGIIRPALILEELDKGIRNTLKQERDDALSQDGMELCVCLLDAGNGQIEYAGANRPLVLVCNGELEVIKPDKRGLGGRNYGHEPAFTNHERKLRKGTWLYMYSDGYTDQFGGRKDKKFTSKRLKNKFLEISGLTAEEQYHALDNTLCQWMANTEQTDDIIVIGVGV